MPTPRTGRQTPNRCRVAVLVAVGCLAAVATACDDPAPPVCEPGFTHQGDTCVDVDECTASPGICEYGPCSNTEGSYVCLCAGVPSPHQACPELGCTPEVDPDPDTLSFGVTHVGISAQDGFNLDGVNSAPPPRGGGGNLAGCFVVDATGGIDDALESLADTLDGAVDLRAGVEASPASLTVTVGHFTSSGGANDPCVSVDLHVVGGGIDETIHGRGSVTNDVVFAVFEASVAIPIAPVVSESACATVPCTPATLGLRLGAPRVRLTLNAEHTAIESPSVLGGWMFVTDASPAYASWNTEGWLASVATWQESTGLSASAAATMNDAILGARDMHQNLDGTSSPCSGTGPTAAVANSLSVQLSLDSL